MNEKNQSSSKEKFWTGLPLLIFPIVIYTELAFFSIQDDSGLLNSKITGCINIAALVFHIAWSIFLHRRNFSRVHAFFSMLSKIVLIPFYIGAFVVGLIALLMPMGFLLALIIAIADAIIFFATSFSQCLALCGLKKRGTLTTTQFTVFSVLNWIYCADVVAAFLAWRAEKKSIKE